MAKCSNCQAWIHLELTGRELDAALRALLHVDRDPSLAVRALRHVPLELDAALRARRRVLRDEGAALAALDHLAEAVDFPVHRDAGRSEEHTSELQSQSNLVCR